MDESLPAFSAGCKAIAAGWHQTLCILLAAFLCLAATNTQARAEHTAINVLIINQSAAQRAWPTAVIDGIQTAMPEVPSRPISFFIENLDLYDFDSPRYRESVQGHLGEKYRDKRPSLVIPIGAGALDVTLKLRAALWPGTPIVFAGVDEKSVPRPLPPDVTGATLKMTLASMMEAARVLVPNLQAFAIVGNRIEERLYYRSLIQELPAYAAKYKLIDLTGLPLDDVRRDVATLPDDSVILYIGIHSDRNRIFKSAGEALPLVAKVANRPIVAAVNTYLGLGAAGGFLVNPERVGRNAGARALRILNGENASSIPVSVDDVLTPMWDWRALRRWNVSESSLPEHSEVMFRESGIWSQYGFEIASVLALILVQTGLIIGLLYEHRRRRKAEALARNELSDLAHMSRLAAAGELSASIAHEINQPLAGIVANAEAGRRWVSGPKPDIDEARRTFEQIGSAGRRAAEVIERIRRFFKKGTPQWELLDINELVRDVLLLIDADLRRRRLTVEVVPTTPLPKIRGDRIQLQQVVLNLVVNAADAMELVTDRERILRVKTEPDPSLDVRVEVQDSGPGIAAADLDSVFAPFYTTKSNGMGMGLSISRSLIEAHGGRIWATQALPFGTIFTFVLPAADDHSGDAASGPWVGKAATAPAQAE